MLGRRIGAGVLALVAAGSLTACGGSSSGAGGGGGAAAGGDRIAVQHTAFGRLIQSMTAKTDGDWSTHTAGTMSIDASGQSGAVKFTGDAKKDAHGLVMGAQYDLAMGAQQLSMTMVLTSDAMYMKLPASLGIPADKPWVKITANGTDPVSKQLGPQLQQLKESADPRQALSYLRDNDAVKIDSMRPEAVNGVAADRYDVTVDVQKALANKQSALTAEQREAMATANLKTLDESIWIGKDGLPLRMAMNMPLGGLGTMKMDMSFSDWGKKVTITVPTDDQISAMPGS